MDQATAQTFEMNIEEARNVILLSQGFHFKDDTLTGKGAVNNIIRRLTYIQIDSISVVERAHHHSLWNRVANYQHLHLEQLLEEKQIFEYWSHAASYLPMIDYRYSLPRKRAITSGERHWFEKDKKVMKHVVQRIQQEGPLQAADFKEDRGKTNGWWDWKPAKKALEQLFMEGELMVVRRNNFQKIYDLTERVVPSYIDVSMPTDEEYYRHLIVSYLSANAIGTPEQMSYLLKGLKPHIYQECKRMELDGLLIRVRVANKIYFALPDVMNLLKNKENKRVLKVLSPFDNLLIQRKRTSELFDFDYRIECYVPASKRKIGYFSMPLLWGNEFAGRMDAKMDRKNRQLQILNLHIETKVTDEFIADLKTMLYQFMKFNQADNICLNKVSTSTDVNSDKLLNAVNKAVTKHFSVTTF